MALALLILASLATAAEAQQSGPIGVEADNVTHDAQRNASRLNGDVRITRGEMQVTAEEGYAYRSDNGYERIELFGEPVRWRTLNERGEETTGYSDQVVYDLIERSVTLIGNAHIEDPRGTYSGQRLVYNLETEGVRGEGGVRLSIEPEVIDDDTGEPSENDPEPN
jgi:lipopolysaccharide export system protein LptA